MLTRFALVLSISLAAAGATDAAIPRHDATGLVGDRTEAVIEMKNVSPVPAPVIAEDITLGANTES